ncbi:MAG: hypothetical protein DRI46_09295 [Chloroflexi bacterium]|nr:MAG: hypothetical protein DRI46_09295 [Chloroflexota bacterium]
MTQKPETRYAKRVNDKIKDMGYGGITVEKTNNPYRGGIWDFYYERETGLLWVEYKFIPKAPPKIIPNLSELQKAWGQARFDNDIPCGVLVGIGTGRATRGLWFDNPGEWLTGYKRDEAPYMTMEETVELLRSKMRRSHRGWE